jgi:hypothetical protein
MRDDDEPNENLIRDIASTLTPQQRTKIFSEAFASDLFKLIALDSEKARKAEIDLIAIQQSVATECIYMAAKIIAQCSDMTLAQFLTACQVSFNLAKRHAEMTPDPNAKPN